MSVSPRELIERTARSLFNAFPPYTVAILYRPYGACPCDLDDRACYMAGHWKPRIPPLWDNAPEDIKLQYFGLAEDFIHTIGDF